MKRLISGLLTAVVASTMFGLVLAEPAHASQTCNVTGSPPLEVRHCAVNKAIVGAEFDGGYIWWYYGNNLAPRAFTPMGSITGTIYDTSDDGSCAWLSLQHVNASGVAAPAIKWISVCGKGAHKNLPADGEDYFNAGEASHTHLSSDHYTSGTWNVYLHTESLKVKIASQAVNLTQP